MAVREVRDLTVQVDRLARAIEIYLTSYHEEVQPFEYRQAIALVSKQLRERLIPEHDDPWQALAFKQGRRRWRREQEPSS
jgi:hypothetical protein